MTEVEVVWTGGGAGTTTTKNKTKQKQHCTSHPDMLQMLILEGQTFALHRES